MACSHGKAWLGFGAGAVRHHRREGGKEEDGQDRGDPWHLAQGGGHGLRRARAITGLKSGQGLQMPLQLYLSRTNFAPTNLTSRKLGIDESSTFLYI